MENIIEHEGSKTTVEKPTQDIVKQTQNNLFIGLTGSVATIKIFHLLEEAKNRGYNIKWHSSEKGKQFILSSFYYNLKKIIASIDDDIIKKKLKRFNMKVYNNIDKATQENISLDKIFIEFKGIIKKLEIDKIIFSSIIDMINSHEEGIDLEGVISKEKGHIKHINIAEWADQVLLAPITANTISKITNGTTDNFLVEVARAIPGDKKVYLAVSMNTHMLEDPFVQKNINDIEKYGKGKYNVIPAITKTLQCGVDGDGAMEEVNKIFDIIQSENSINDKEKTDKAKLGIVITSGGTNVYIDDVRCITNFSKGTTGSFIAQETLEQGHNVKYICSKEAKQPFESDLKVDIKKELQTELERVEKVANQYSKVKENLEIIAVRDFYEYHKNLLETIKNKDVDVAILTMAASDYGVETADGKISSDKEELAINMKKLPKIISEIKEVRKDIFLVGFKLLTDSTPEQLIEIAYKAVLKNRQNLVVANIALNNSFSKFVTYIVTAEKAIINIPERKDLQRILMETIENRVSKQYYHTQFTKVETLPFTEAKIDGFVQDIKKAGKLALFESYTEGDKREFGFVAKRTDKGTLISGRGSSKNNANKSDIALITDMDQDNRTIQVKSIEKKASLNGNLAHYIFEERKDINYIVHAHINFALVQDIERETSPGTQEDLEAIKGEIEKGSNIISQPNHGVLILMKDINELTNILKEHNIYNTQAEYYDLAYSRFAKNSRFIDIIKEQVKKDGNIIDMCTGTGEVTKDLIEEGYSNIVCADGSHRMLNIAKEKNNSIGDNQFQLVDMEEIDFENKFDAMVIRQAINYIEPDKMVKVFSGIRKSLKEGGKFIFNSFILNKTPGTRTIKDETEEFTLKTYENNLAEGNKIYHGQQTHLFDKQTGIHKKIYDINSFYVYSKEEFEQSLEKAGFSNIKIIIEKSSLYIIATK